MQMADMKEPDLVSIDHDDWAVADGEPDVRGWDVYTADDRKIGEVDDLLADPNVMKVCYLTVDLDSDVSAAADEPIRIPISRARIDEADRKVIVDFAATNLENVSTAPAERWKDDRVRMTRAAEELRIGKRQVPAGEVAVKKRVETEHVRKNVALRGEDVDIERRPVSGRAADRDVEITAQEVRVPVYEEEAVVEKRPVVKEEVIISKRPTERTQPVEAEVREEHIDVDKRTGVRGVERERTRK
jgi:uncharacterized protein (TIGR02271 family)